MLIKDHLFLFSEVDDEFENEQMDTAVEGN
jgi:hypothetical protein